MAERLKQLPPAPDALKTAIRIVQKKDGGRYGDISLDMQEHAQALEEVKGFVMPVLEALSYPEKISDDKTQIFDHRNWAEGFVRQENLWRRNLSFAPHFNFEGQDYVVGVMGKFDQESNLRQLSFETTYRHDVETVAWAGPVEKGQRTPAEVFRVPSYGIASSDQLESILELAKSVAHETPKQALEQGRISPNWMERWNLRGLQLQEGFPYSESFPPISFSTGKDNLYEVITWNGSREVCKIVKGGQEHGWSDQKGELLWLEDVHGEVVHEESRVAAWRQVWDPSLPEYYSRAKYPRIYQDAPVKQAQV